MDYMTQVLLRDIRDYVMGKLDQAPTFPCEKCDKVEICSQNELFCSTFLEVALEHQSNE